MGLHGCCRGINMALPFKELLSSTLAYNWVFLHEKSSSHVASFNSRFFHLMRYSPITQFICYLVLYSNIVYDSSIFFPYSSIFSRIAWTSIFSPITLFKQETWKIGCTFEYGGNSNPLKHLIREIIP